MDHYDDVLFAPRTDFGAVNTISLPVEIIGLANGYERRNIRCAKPKRQFLITTGQRPLSDLISIKRFFEARHGAARSFRFEDPLNNSTAISGIEPSGSDVGIGIGDGTKNVFQLVDLNKMAITKPLVETLIIQLDGIPQTIDTDFTADAQTGQIIFLMPPPGGAVITAGCRFHIHVRFENETLTVLTTAKGAGEIEELRLIEVFS